MAFACRHREASFRVQIASGSPEKDLALWDGDGVIVPIQTRRSVATFRRLGVPVVNISGLMEDTGFPSVLVEDVAAGRLAAEHLLEMGVRHFGYLGLRGAAYARRRGEGFIQTVGQAGFPCEQLTLALNWYRGRGASEAHRRLEDWLDRLPKPVGVLSCDDSNVPRLVSACQALGIGIPEDLALIGVNNNELVCDTVSPPASSVDTDLYQVGFEAGALMHRLLSGERPPKTPILVPPRGVQRRQSTDVLAAGDPLVSDALRLMRRRAHEPVTIADILDALPASRRSIELHFREAIGRSPSEELRRLRLDRVAAMLGDGDLSLEEIASQCGFQYREQMWRAFRKAFGTSPGAYRRQRRRP
jgi:LacI family transcriptional regulator